jgi:ABC-type glycerol-3-phosphate transport system substrate-binding protein
MQNSVKMVDGGTVKFHEDQSTDGRNKGVDALDFYTLFAKKEFSDRGPIWSDRLATSVDAFVAGKVAMILAPAARIPDILAKVTQSGAVFSVKAAPAPQAVAGGNQVNWASYWAEAVAKNSPGKAVAWDLVKFLSSKETLRQLYAEQAKVRQMSWVPSRTDLAEEYSNQAYLGAYLAGAKTARSWYLASGTGDQSLNDPIISIFAAAVSTALGGSSQSESALKTAASSVETVLVKYGLATATQK